jgi:formate hydrogenlyase subunit 3/multisubunit Na+/H+ antiporter MnhD subunit
MPLMSPLYPVIILILGAVVLPLVSRVVRVRIAQVLALIVAASSLASCLVLYWDQPTTWSADLWRPSSLFALELAYRADGLSLGFLLLTASVAMIAVLSAHSPPDSENTQAEPYGALFLVTAGAFSVLLSDNLVTMCLSWGLLDLGLLALAGIAHGGRRASRTGLRLLLVNYLGGVALLAALLVFQGQGQTFSLQAAALPTKVISLVMLAALVRLALYPAFIALPSRVDIKLRTLILWHIIPVSVGGYLLARVLSLTAAASFPGHEVALVLGSLAVILSPFPLWFASDLRSMAPFLILNQVGHMALAAAIAAPYSAAIIVSQAVGLVLALSLLLLSQRTADGIMPRKHEVWKRCCVLVAFASLAATPLTVGFVSRQLLYQSLMESGLAPLILLSLLANSLVVAPFLKVGLEQPSEQAGGGQMLALLLGSLTALAAPLVLWGIHPPFLGLLMGPQSSLAAWPVVTDLIYSAGTPWTVMLFLGSLLSLAAGYLLYRNGETIVARAGISLETLQTVAQMEWLYGALDWTGQRVASVLEQVGGFFEDTRSPGWILVFATLVALLLLTI